MEETAYAKINLALHVRSREADGYHRIETLFAFAEAGDRLSVAPADALTLTVAGRFAGQLGPPADNLVLRAAESLREHHQITDGAALTLDKRLPVASGIGGGSADAAAALRLLSRWWRLPSGDVALLDIARGLGADVPACLASLTVRGEGRGDILAPYANDPFTGLPLLLVNPGVPVATTEVFRAWDCVDRGPLPGDSPLGGRNDLEPAALRIAPVIAQVLARLRDSPGATGAGMSGSGATCFAVFANDLDRDSAAAAIVAARPTWWTLATRLR